jgi:hypothetical protein
MASEQEAWNSMALSRPDQCPMCGSLNWIALNADGTRFSAFRQSGLWHSFKCDECGHVWPFRFIHVMEAAK